MLQYARVSRHQCWRGKAEDLPVREVPGHKRQYDAQRLKLNVAFGRVRRHVFIGEELFGIVGVVVAVQGALLNFCLGLDDGLAHL